MMKISKIIVAAFLSVVISGCTTNWNRPDGFNEADKEFVTLRFQMPIMRGLPHNAAEAMSFQNYMAIKLADSKRFHVEAVGYKSKYITENSTIIELKPTIRLDKGNVNKRNALYALTVHLDCGVVDGETGILDPRKTFSVVSSGRDKVPLYFDEYSKPNMSTLYEKAYQDLMKNFIKELNYRLPVTGSLKNIHVYKGKVTAELDCGMADGVEPTDDILIYAVENDRITPVIALAKSEIAAYKSVLTIAEWNTSNPEVKDLLMPRLLRRDTSLKLYAVCRKADK